MAKQAGHSSGDDKMWAARCRCDKCERLRSGGHAGYDDVPPEANPEVQEEIPSLAAFYSHGYIPVNLGNIMPMTR